MSTESHKHFNFFPNVDSGFPLHLPTGHHVPRGVSPPPLDWDPKFDREFGFPPDYDGTYNPTH